MEVGEVVEFNICFEGTVNRLLLVWNVREALRTTQKFFLV